MQNIQFINMYTLQFKKPWIDKEIDVARCLGMEVSGDIITVDTRVIAAKALKEFMVFAFPIIMMSSRDKVFRDTLFGQLRTVYKDIYGQFMEDYYPKSNYSRELFEHQKRSLSLMIHRRCNLLSFSPGGGKTITSISITKILRIPRTIIITPASLKWQWYHELTDEWGFNKMKWTILDTKKNKSIFAFEERFVVCNYEMIDKHFDHLTKYDVGHIIVDEIHYAKNTKSKRFKHLYKLIKKFPKARITMLTGTPITNRINDMFSYFKIAGHPLGDNYSKFIRNYTVSQSSRGGFKIVGSKNIEELRLKISNFMIRKRTEDYVDLPQLLIKKYYFDMGDIKGEYNDHIKKLYDNKIELDQATTSQEKREVNTKIRGNIHTLNRILATDKVQKVIPLIDQLIENGRDVIVFSGYRNPIHLLEEHYGYSCVKVIGGMDSHEKNRVVNKFINDPSCKLFLGNFKAAGVGTNLVNSHDVIFLNFPFTPDDLEQSYKRAHRIGQKQNVNVYYTIVRDSIDERTFSLVSEKSKDIDSLLDHGKNSVVHYGNIQNELFKTLMKDYESKNNIKQEEFSSIN